MLLSRVGISAGKKYFLPLAGFNRCKPAKSGRKWQKWKWPTGSLYMLLNASKHFHMQYLMSSAKLTADNYATTCCLSLNIIIILFSLTSGSERRQPTSDGKQRNFLPKSNFKYISLFIYMLALVLNKNKKVFDDEVDFTLMANNMNFKLY